MAHLRVLLLYQGVLLDIVHLESGPLVAWTSRLLYAVRPTLVVQFFNSTFFIYYNILQLSMRRARDQQKG